MAYVTDYREMFTLFSRRPGMYLPNPVSFATAVAFIQGCDTMSGGEMLDGFRDWLVSAKLGQFENSLVWWALVLHLVEPAGPKDARNLNPEADAAALDLLFALVDEFLDHRG
ncbi:hypothetical protein GCM10023196_055270 [Actinoallomurus vinaceus]|uniref:Uncharacterized protein n=1 Tax=Actinoallomurus vinaceus TaxID=1080074 RepID=A0ABP8UHC4_9ACTN